MRSSLRTSALLGAQCFISTNYSFYFLATNALLWILFEIFLTRNSLDEPINANLVLKHSIILYTCMHSNLEWLEALFLAQVFSYALTVECKSDEGSDQTAH